MFIKEAAQYVLQSPRLALHAHWYNEGGIFETMFFLKAQCLASILVGWLQLASGVVVCYLAVKYVTIKIKIFWKKSLKVKILSLDITYVMFFGVSVQEID